MNVWVMTKEDSFFKIISSMMPFVQRIENIPEEKSIMLIDVRYYHDMDTLSKASNHYWIAVTDEYHIGQARIYMKYGARSIVLSTHYDVIIRDIMDAMMRVEKQINCQFISVKGGSGTTSLALHLALWFSRQNKPVSVKEYGKQSIIECLDHHRIPFHFEHLQEFPGPERIVENPGIWDLGKVDKDYRPVGPTILVFRADIIDIEMATRYMAQFETKNHVIGACTFVRMGFKPDVKQLQKRIGIPVLLFKDNRKVLNENYSKKRQLKYVPGSWKSQFKTINAFINNFFVVNQ